MEPRGCSLRGNLAFALSHDAVAYVACANVAPPVRFDEFGALVVLGPRKPLAVSRLRDRVLAVNVDSTRYQGFEADSGRRRPAIAAQLKARAVIDGRSVNSIVTDAIEQYTIAHPVPRAKMLELVHEIAPCDVALLKAPAKL